VVYTKTVVRHGDANKRHQKPSNRKGSLNDLIKTQEICKREKQLEVKQLRRVDQTFDTRNLQKLQENHLNLRYEHDQDTEKSEWCLSRRKNQENGRIRQKSGLIMGFPR
jgi:hypothetical protein